MTQEELWNLHYSQLMCFIQQHRRRPSKYYEEERLMVHWFKHNKRLMLQGKMSDHRRQLFQTLLNEAAKYQRINQHAYVNKPVLDQP